MPNYKLSPFAAFVESRLVADATQYAIFHRLTGQMLEPDASVFALLEVAKKGRALSLTPAQLIPLGESGRQIQQLIEFQLLIEDGRDPLALLIDHYVGRPLQNPAITYKNEAGDVVVVSISMAERAFSPEPGTLPPILEDVLPELSTKILLAADNTKTLRQIYAAYQPESELRPYDEQFRKAIDFLTKPERQLIKLAPTVEGFANPFYPANLVPRNLYHSPGPNRPARGGDAKSLTNFHEQGIGSASWEFDVIEPTVNHAFRFPTEALGDLSYGARFCASILNQQPDMGDRPLKILEIGGGTGTFARAFNDHLRAEGVKAQYHILDLAPALIETQRQFLADLQPSVVHHQQDATDFAIPGTLFDLIIANEVIADFPVAEVKRKNVSAGDPQNYDREWVGDGADYVAKYGLSTADAPDSFLVNTGTFEFIERAWRHLAPGGLVVLTEYGGSNKYPVEAHHLNHAEFSIHFGHVIECAQKIGFRCRLEGLSDFLNVKSDVPVLNGSNEHIQCLNHVFQKHGDAIEYRVISEREFRERYQQIVNRIDLRGFSFQPLRNKFHYGPNLDDFMALSMKKPLT